jgi:CRP/FNR family transcriptional regulator, cyclic AMP receptor protein
MTTSTTDLLERTKFAVDMPPRVRETLAALGKVGDHEEGAVLVRAGVPCPALGVILHGRIAIRQPIPGMGRRTILAGSSATSDAVAVAPTRVILFERAALTEALEADPLLAAAVYQRVLSAVARRLQSTRMQLLDLYRAGDEPW